MKTGERLEVQKERGRRRGRERSWVMERRGKGKRKWGRISAKDAAR